MLFLLRGDYFSLVERFLRIKYIYMRHFKETTLSYNREGWLMLVQMVLELLLELYQIGTLVRGLKQAKR